MGLVQQGSEDGGIAEVGGYPPVVVGVVAVGRAGQEDGVQIEGRDPHGPELAQAVDDALQVTAEVLVAAVGVGDGTSNATQ